MRCRIATTASPLIPCRAMTSFVQEVGHSDENALPSLARSGFVAGAEAGGECLGDLDVDADPGRSETTNSGRPELPEPINAPTSVLRSVTMPSNGATICLKDSMASRCRTYASAAGRNSLGG